LLQCSYSSGSDDGRVVEFIDETNNLASEFCVESEGQITPSAETPRNSSIVSNDELSTANENSPHGTGYSQEYPEPPILRIPPERSGQQHELPVLSAESITTFSRPPLTEASRQRSWNVISSAAESNPQNSHWPLRDPQQALLLQHFVERVSLFVSFIHP